jgi:hypothetical protein
MPAAIPLLRKSPFRIDPRPLHEPSSAHAGLLAVSRALRSLGLPALVEANLKLKRRRRGLSEAQYVEAAVLLNALGGDSYEDIELIERDECVSKGLGYRAPKATALRQFVEAFHDPGMEARPQGQLAFIPDPGQRLEDLARVNHGLIGRVAARYEAEGRPLRSATVDLDATIVECHKREAYWTYEGTRGYQPLVASWAEADLVLAEEFRDGNVPAGMQPLRVTQEAFEALPTGIQRRGFRGDSACYEQKLMEWLDAVERQQEPGGAIEFAISVDMSRELLAEIRALRPGAWKLLNVETNNVRRECAEVAFVPSRRYEAKHSRPLRYLAIRLVKPQGELFDDGQRYRHFAIVTNRREAAAEAVIEWHRGKAGTVEHVHDEMKNGLAPQHLPSGKFGANAAWWRLAAISYNVFSAIRALSLEEPLRRAKIRTLRLHLIDLSGRMNRNGCRRTLRFCATPEQIARIVKLWRVFDLPTQATAFQ